MITPVSKPEMANEGSQMVIEEELEDDDFLNDLDKLLSSVAPEKDKVDARPESSLLPRHVGKDADDEDEECCSSDVNDVPLRAGSDNLPTRSSDVNDASLLAGSDNVF